VAALRGRCHASSTRVRGCQGVWGWLWAWKVQPTVVPSFVLEVGSPSVLSLLYAKMRPVIFKTVVCRAHHRWGCWSLYRLHILKVHVHVGMVRVVILPPASRNQWTPGRAPWRLRSTPRAHPSTPPGLDTARLKAQMAQHESSRQRAEGLNPRGSLLLHSRVIETSRWGVRLSYFLVTQSFFLFPPHVTSTQLFSLLPLFLLPIPLDSRAYILKSVLSRPLA